MTGTKFLNFSHLECQLLFEGLSLMSSSSLPPNRQFQFFQSTLDLFPEFENTFISTAQGYPLIYALSATKKTHFQCANYFSLGIPVKLLVRYSTKEVSDTLFLQLPLMAIDHSVCYAGSNSSDKSENSCTHDLVSYCRYTDKNVNFLDPIVHIKLQKATMIDNFHQGSILCINVRLYFHSLIEY